MANEFDRRAEAWVRKRYPDANPDPGSVEFATDCAAYDSGGWATIEVGWTENGSAVGGVLIDDAWQADLTWIIRELLAVELPEQPAQSPGG